MKQENDLQGNSSKQGTPDINQIIAAMKSWIIKFKDRAPTEMEMVMLAKEYHEDLREEKISSELFYEICMILRRKSEYFPKMANVLFYKEEAQEIINRRNIEKAKKTPKIEDTRHKQTGEFGAICSANINLMINGSISMERAIHLNTPIYLDGRIDMERVSDRNKHLDSKSLPNPSSFVKSLHKSIG